MPQSLGLKFSGYGKPSIGSSLGQAGTHKTPHTWGQAALRESLSWQAEEMAGQLLPPSWSMGTSFCLVYTLCT